MFKRKIKIRGDDVCRKNISYYLKRHGVVLRHEFHSAFVARTFGNTLYLERVVHCTLGEMGSRAVHLNDIELCDVADRVCEKISLRE